MLRTKILILSLIAVVCIGSQAVAGTPLLSSSVEVLSIHEGNDISVRLKFTLKNESENPVDVLKWGTPLEGEWTNDCLDVRYDGQPVSYVGMLVKRGTPGPDDYVRIGAHQEATGIVDLEKGYEIYQPGEYTVQYRGGTITAGVLSPADPGESAQTDAINEQQIVSSSNPVAFSLLAGTDEPVTFSHPLASCTQAQMNVINAALPEARRIALTAKNALNSAPGNLRPQAQRYLEWFGVYASSRYSIVTGHFNRISDALATEHIYAGCVNQNIYARVYPSQPYTIYFGNLFWSAPLNGTDSKAGTFVHEMSHFSVIAGTKDHVYGQTKARNLARIDPNAAIDNADNHEYFAENNPPLSMPAPSAPPPSSGGDGDDGGSGGCFIHSLGY